MVYACRAAVTLWIGVFGAACAVAGENAADALNAHQYPWYDAQTRSVKPLKIRAGNDSQSKERNTIVIGKPPATKPPPAITTGGRWAGGTAGGGSSVFMVIVAGVILIGVVLLVLTFLYIESNKSAQVVASSRRSRQQSIEQLPFDLDVTKGDFQSAAESAYRSGDLRKAIIYLYSHVLVTLDQNQLIRLRKGKTNRQYLTEVQRHHGMSGYFSQIMLPFEAVFFGDHEMDADVFQQCWAGLNQFHARVKGNTEASIR